MKELWFESAGTRLFAVEDGDGDALVLLHGGLANHQSIRLWAAPLAARYRLITPDLRASGRSIDARTLAWPQLADDIAAVIAHLGITRAAVGGISFGSGVAVATALRHPALVSALVIVHPVYGGTEIGLLPAQRAAMETMDRFGSRAPAEGPSVMSPLLDTLPAELRERARAVFATYDPASIAATTRFLASGLHPFASACDLAAITCPALLVPGIDPQHPTEISELYRRHLRHCQTVATADFASAIAAFLDQR